MDILNKTYCTWTLGDSIGVVLLIASVWSLYELIKWLIKQKKKKN